MANSIVPLPHFVRRGTKMCVKVVFLLGSIVISDPRAPEKIDRLKLRFYWGRVYENSGMKEERGS